MSETSVIHDIGYQRYQGPRLGRGSVIGAMYVHGLRAAFGFGRSAQSKIFPWLVAGITLLVAVIVTAIRSQAGVVVLNYVQFDDAMSWLIIFFVAICAPELVSRDMRSGVLPLYFKAIAAVPAVEIVAQGNYDGQAFAASQVLAKCPSKFKAKA